MSKPSSSTPESRQASAVRRYDRNMEFVRKFKEECGCQQCDTHFPHYVLETVPSISSLAASRCKLEVLEAAIKHVTVICANCRKTAEWNSSNRTSK